MERMIITKSFDAFTKAVKSLYGELSATPERVVKEMFSKLDGVDWKNPDLKILDPAAGFGTFLREAYIRLKEFHSEEHILNNMLYACEINGFKTLFLERKMGLRNIYKGDFLTMKLPEGWPKEFDIVVSNPPYSKNLHLKFLEKSFFIAEEILFVHPSTWLLDEKGSSKNYAEIKKLIGNKIKSIDFFNGNPIFGINLYVPCVITHIDNKKNTNKILCKDLINDTIFEYSDINTINKFSNTELYPGLKSKILNYVGKNCSIKEYSDRDGIFYLNLSEIRGHGETNTINKMVKDDFYTFVPKSYTIKERKDAKYFNCGFPTEGEAYNFLNYLKSDFARFCLSIYKINSTLAGTSSVLNSVPWLDFTQEWTDENLYAHFQISEEEQEFIKEIIPPYYD